MERIIIRNRIMERESYMDKKVSGTGQSVRVSIRQRILDNPFVLLSMGVVFPAVFYIIWGIMELVSIPIAP